MAPGNRKRATDGQFGTEPEADQAGDEKNEIQCYFCGPRVGVLAYQHRARRTPVFGMQALTCGDFDGQ